MIARELLVKLGFDIDSAKLDKFNASIDATKNRMQAIRSNSMQGIASVGGNKLANAISPETNNRISVLKNYNDELASLSKSERAEVLALNKVENQAIKETTQVEKTELKERQRFTKEQFREKQNLQRSQQRDFKTSMASMSSMARKFAIVGAAITAGFGLSLRSTLKDAANFKEGKSSSSFDKSQISTVDAFNKTLNTTKSTVANLRNVFAIGMLPAIEKTLKVFNAWIEKNKARILEKLTKIADGLSKAFTILSEIIERLVTAFDFVIEKTVGWKVAISSIIVLGASAWFISLTSSILATARAFKVLIATTLIGSFISAITTIRTIGMAAWFGGLVAPILAAASAFKVFALAILSNPLTWVIAGIASAFIWLTDEMVAFRNGGKTTADLLKEWGGGWAVFGGEIERVYTNISNLIDAFKELDAVKISKSLAKMLNPFSMFTDNEVIKVGFEKGVNKLSNHFNNDSGKLGQGNIKHLAMPKYTPEEVTRVPNSSITNNARSSNVNQNFSFNISVPLGTSQEQAISITKIVQSQLEKLHQQTLTAIGSN